jgi:DNA-binding transcriptional ArsR family regulator
MTETPREPRELDARSLLALAHPLRIRMLNRLMRGEPATASQLAGELKESSGSTSYHLRMLERHGFVIEEAGLGSRRERFWRAVPGGIHLRGYELLGDEATRAATRLLVDEVHRQAAEHLEHWLSTTQAWSTAWRDASTDAVYALHLDPAETADLKSEIEGVLNRRRGRRPGPTTRSVEVHVDIFPTGDPA